MGVHGLWRLIEPSGKPVPLETLENKVLAVDISIWLHQAVKGFQDARGAPLPNAHLLGIYHRVCKLLFFRIKPVFVFDGGVPALKKQTIAKRSQHSSKLKSDATSIQQKILTSLLKHSAIQKVLSEEGEAATDNVNKNILLYKKPKEDIFKLPEPVSSDLDTTQESEFTDSDSSPTKWDLHTIDEKSSEFLALPPEVRHDILTECMGQRKQSSWGRLHQLPKQSGDFSCFQMNRLLKRFSVKQALDETSKEMGGHSLSLNELEALLTEEGIVTASNKSTKRIAANEHQSYLFIKDMKKAIEKAKNDEMKRKNEEAKDENSQKQESEPETVSVEEGDKSEKSKDVEYERDLQEAIKLSLMETPSTSKDNESFDYLLGFNDGDFESSSDSEEEFYILPKKSRTAAESYMLEYADLTPYEVDNLFKKDNRPEKNKSKKGKTNNNTNNDSELKKIDENSKNQKEITPIIKNNLDNEQQNYDKNINTNQNLENTENSDKKNLNLSENFNEKLVNKNLFIAAEKQIDKINYDKLETEPKIPAEKENLTVYEICKDEKDTPEVEDLKKIEIKDVKTRVEETEKHDIGNEKISEEKISEHKIQVELMSDSDDSDLVEIESKTENQAVEVQNENPATKENAVELMSDSDDSDLVKIESKTENRAIEVKKENPAIKEDAVELMSDSDDSDFVEVDPKISPPKPGLQLIIDPSKKVEDDLFKEIFDEAPIKLEEIIKQSKPIEQKNNIVNIFDIKKQDSVMLSNAEPKSEIKIVEIVDEKLVKPEDNEDGCTNEKSSKKVSFDVEVKEKSRTPEKKKNENGKEVVKKPKISVEELKKMKDDLQKEQQELMVEKNAKDRMGSDITTQMYQEAQELLELFGVPYLIAPMEAEAQCAFLNQIGLTDGTITDDSDIWLFGGNTVYKNFFNQKKHVLEYKADTIQHHFRLSREQMILLALLVGSDYTLGIQGIGPVTALEILAAFPPLKKQALSTSEMLSGLREFKHWFYDGGKLGLGRTTLRSKLQNIQISEGFPSTQVVQAYLQPEVETNEDAFSWSKPDVVGLIDYAREKFGWTRLKSEEILNPVIKKLEDATKQKTLRDYFATKHKIEIDLTEGKVSKRVKMAIEKMGKTREELTKEEQEKASTNKRKNGKKTDPKDKKELKTNKRKPRELMKLTLDDDGDEVNVIVQEAQDLFANLEEKIDNHEQFLKSKDDSGKDKPKTVSRKGDDISSRQRKGRIDTEAKPKIQRRNKSDLHVKEVIPQREKEKSNALKTKLKAIEIYRKSKIEGKHEKKVRKVRQPKEDAELSESSDSS